MSRTLICQLLLLAAVLPLRGVEPPGGLVGRTGDKSVVLHWDKSTEPDIAGYNVYRSLTPRGPFVLQSTAGLIASPGYCDLSPEVVNGQTNYYQVTTVSANSQESCPTPAWAAVPHAFAGDDEFLDYIQQVHFDYFWYLANPSNGLVPDRTAKGAACSIAAVGFGLTTIAIGIDHGWISRAQGAARVLTTLNTFLHGPQGTNTAGMIGYRGWFYHFLDMNNAVRAGAELSSIDTALLLAGVLDARQYFTGADANETAIRAAADALFNRVDWNWMAKGGNVVSMGWYPESGFIASDWIGYNEAMVLYCLGLGAPTNPLPALAWQAWTSGYEWTNYYGYAYLPFGPLFGHQYSHCWIDFRPIADPYMRNHHSTYFENSRRACLAQQAYCVANPLNHPGLSGIVWGLTACDGPSGYSAHGAPPEQNDDGTIAPTAAGAAIAFTPEYSLPTLRYLYTQYRPRLWTAYGFRDAFNLGQGWVGTDELGIDQGPIVIMIENYRTQRVWRRFMQHDVVRRGLRRAGFVAADFAVAHSPPAPAQHPALLKWEGPAGGGYPVEYSADLSPWFESAVSNAIAPGPSGTWIDSGPPPTPNPSSFGSPF